MANSTTAYVPTQEDWAEYAEWRDSIEVSRADDQARLDAWMDQMEKRGLDSIHADVEVA